MLMGNAMMLRLIPVYESFFRGDKDRWRRNSGELFYVACKLGRRPWRLSGLARRASSKTRVGLFPHVWSSSSPSSLTFSH